MYIDSVGSEYIRSELFIHDELARRAERAVRHCKEIWRKQGKVSAFILIWPTDTVKTEKGEKHSGIIQAMLPPAGTARDEFYKNAQKRTNPYALLIVEQYGNQWIEATFESHHGVLGWRYPIKKHGDVYVLGDLEKVQSDGVGILRRPLSGHA